MTCNDTLTIRRARRSDLAAVDALFARAYPALLKADYAPSTLVLALPRIARAQPALLSMPGYMVAEGEDGALRAAGGWSPGQRPGLGRIRHLATDHRHTRQGIGRRLMTHVLDHARDAGIRHMSCLSTRTAVPFYTALGFHALGPVEIALAPGITFPAVAMERAL